MSYQDFLNIYPCKKTNFLHYYQFISAIPKHLITIARNEALIKKELYLNNTFNFQLDRLNSNLWFLKIINIKTQIKFMHQIIVTKRELYRYGIQSRQMMTVYKLAKRTLLTMIFCKNIFTWGRSLIGSM